MGKILALKRGHWVDRINVKSINKITIARLSLYE